MKGLILIVMVLYVVFIKKKRDNLEMMIFKII